MPLRVILRASVLAAVAAVCGIAIWTLWPDRIAVPEERFRTRFQAGPPQALTVPGTRFTTVLREYRDAGQAYAAFRGFAERRTAARESLLLTCAIVRRLPVYAIRVDLSDDLLQSIARAQALHVSGDSDRPGWVLTPSAQLTKWRQQTRMFEELYAAAPAPPPRLVADLVAIADVYSIPLEFFRWSRVAESGYVKPDGTLRHGTWKRVPASNDVVVQKSGAEVLTIPRDSAVWELTDKALRHAHWLYSQGAERYAELDNELRPPRNLQYDVPPRALLSYAGAALRDIVERFDFDAERALRAFSNPDAAGFRQDVGVRRAVLYARRMFEHAIAMNLEAASSKRTAATSRPRQGGRRPDVPASR